MGIFFWGYFIFDDPGIPKLAVLVLGVTTSPLFSIVLLSFVAMGVYGFFDPFFSMPGKFLAGFSAASGIALITSVGNLGGFAGPSVIGAFANGKSGIYEGLAFGRRFVVRIGGSCTDPAREKRKVIEPLRALRNQWAIGETEG